MAAGFLLTRLLLQFHKKFSELHEDLSAIAHTPDGYLWVASDETAAIERLSMTQAHVFGDHQVFHLPDFLDFPDLDETEVDIEGLDYADGYLWVIGSHGTKRKKPKNKKNLVENLERLASVVVEPSRYLLARIPISEGQLVKACPNPEAGQPAKTAAFLELHNAGNQLTQALKDDPHFGLFLVTDSSVPGNLAPLPGKDNGFDIEGLAVHRDRLWIGLRGPVLRGWAGILEIEVAETQSGLLGLKPIGPNNQLYKKHFVDLGGLGIRDLCWQGEDLLILAGPTMELDGSIRVFKLTDAAQLAEQSLTSQESGVLEALFEVPHGEGCDRAEGITLFPGLDQANALLVVYDSPAEQRKYDSGNVLADLFQLP